MGTGTYGQSNPTVINCGFKPKRMVVWAEGSSPMSIGQSGHYLVYGESKEDLGVGTIVQFSPSVCSQLSGGAIVLDNNCFVLDMETTKNIYMFSRNKYIQDYYAGNYSVYIVVAISKTVSDSGVSFVSEQYMSADNSAIRIIDYNSVESRTAASQLNEQGVTYRYIALG